MTAGGRPPMIAGVEIRVDGRPLDPALSGNLIEARVDQHLLLPDVAVVRIEDPGLEHVDSVPFEVGAKLEVRLSAPDSNSLHPAFAGRITAVEPEFTEGGAMLAARAYDASHALNQERRSATYQNMTADDIARKLAARANVQLGTVDPAGPPQPFVQQSGETDLRLLWRLAAAIDFEVVVENEKLHFRRAGGRAAASPLTLRWGDTLLAFRPRVTDAQQARNVTVSGWDATAGRAVQATQPAPGPDSRIGLRPRASSASPGGGATEVADRSVVDQDDADRLARSIASRLANASVEAEGTARGEPGLRAGVPIEVKGVGSRFGGIYAITAVSHRFRGRRGYHTHFTVSGRSVRGLIDLLSPPAEGGWGSSLVVGVVTQNNDPDGLGRVRVKYPALGNGVESAWARVASPGAGQERGALMLPVAGDEVVVGFEHGDVRRPYVLGALWNGQARPGAELPQRDGSFVLRSDHRVGLSAKKDVSIRGGRDLSIETDGKVTQTARGDIAVEGQRVSVKANGTLTVEANGDLSLRAPSMALQASGVLRLSGSQVMLG
jgi:uncharacterized protein involved in type VI secretion and phage assembly